MTEELRQKFEKRFEERGIPKGLISNIILEIYDLEDGTKGYTLDCHNYQMFANNPVLEVIDELVEELIA